jgi:hypothetical protein
MIFLKKKKIFSIDIFIILFLFLFSFFINRHFANLGVFPIDTFLHYDSGYRILNNQYPARDFWITSGIFIDFLEAGFFKLLGVSWNTHVFHSSFINGIISVATYFVFNSLGLNKYYCLVYSLCFSVLAYTVSGTPFVDHHAAFFLLLGVYCFILAIVKCKNIYWVISPWLFGFSFLTKQVPASYLIILCTLILLVYFYLKKDIKIILYLFFSTFLFLIFCFFFIQALNLNNIYVQYFMYPQTIGAERLANLKNIKIISFLNHYKFILIPLITLSFLNISAILKKKYLYNKNNFFIFLLIFSYSLILIFHQILTKNQIYIYFLIPLLFAFLNIFFLKNKKKLNLFLLIITVILTIKLHLEFNQNRKFQDLKGVNLKNALDASLIDRSLNDLNWVSLLHKNNPLAEISMIKEIIDYISIQKDPKILITHYLFFSAILKDNLYSPSRVYTLDGTGFPLIGNKYYNDYKNFFTSLVNKNNIKFIYLIKYEGIDEMVVTNYLDNNCYIKNEKNPNLIIFNIIKKCS